ncbi:hypothetical protein Enr13x_67570 [Stieleria neptunia]|uniref:DUF4177 domain-containing protein n=1 Tax=Stieleria neptunia TaxID=2527979 RepID=A0A518I189_9BACT|nr:hypothetical protein Enr13x_67570 [Stieleria neptunia]
MKRSAYFVIALVFVLVTWFGIAQQPSRAQNANPRQVPAWEYQELEVHGGGFDRAKANKLGASGWELVATFTPTNRDAVSVCIFKRRK